MNIPEIYCKSGLAKEQIQDRLSRDTDGLELQMMFDNTLAELQSQWRAEIKAVHPPLNARSDGLHVELPFDFAPSRPFHYRYLKLLDTLAGKEDRMLRYVLHVKQDKQTLVWTGQYRDFQEQLQIFAYTFQNITFCLENTGTDPRSPYAVSDIVRDAANSRIQTCIDICHLQYALRASELLKGGVSVVNGFEPVLSIEEMFFRNKGQCGLIHLNRCGDDPRWAYGLGGNHGIGFDAKNQEEMVLLKKIWELYQKFEYDCPITIEIQEESYDKAVNYSISRDALKQLDI